MKLNELQSVPFRAKIITYASDYNTAVEKRKDLQQISGYLYKDKNLTDNYGQVYCRLYIFYKDLGIGMDIGGINRPNDYTTEEALAYVRGVGTQKPEDFIEYLDGVVAAGDRITNAEIALARYIAPEKAEQYAEARQKRIDADNARYALRRAKREAEEAAYCEKSNAETQQKIDTAIHTIRTGGILQNDYISFYRSRYNCRSYCMVNYLARQYDVEIPLKVQGWINQKLIEVKIADGKVTECRHQRGRSNTFWNYMNKLIAVVCQDAQAGDAA
ncbi:MAG: hypothetical protein PHY23_00335 [Oscillospiraceae bacterium]|nr:hypothetical protein [Oscillospiraceae bacterium]